MLALYRSGRHAEALDSYQDARRVLTDELGLEPSEALKGLQGAILAHDPSLQPPSAAQAVALEGVDAGGDGAFVGREHELREVLGVWVPKTRIQRFPSWSADE
jgi:DNA-binding SARP family transcriptional activator